MNRKLPVSIQDIEDENEEYIPYDTDKISIDTKVMVLEACLRRIEQGTIILAPDFQRNEVWTPEKKSRLIESILLKIPIPMFYVASDEKGIYSVVDGLQRLSAIRDFVLGKKYMAARDPAMKGDGLKLDKLEFWGHKYNGCTFNTLPMEMQNRILETEFTFTIINPGTPEEVKRNIFKRLNTGGEPLTLQEIRNALYTGESTELLKRLAQKKEFLAATGNSVKPDRMLDRELVLRFLAFIIRDYTVYPKNSDMDRFLSDTMRIINLMPNFNNKAADKFFNEEWTEKDRLSKKDILIKNRDDLEPIFIRGMVRTKEIFGGHAFRRSYEGKRKAPINKALFELLSVSLAKQSNAEYAALLKNKISFLSEYGRLLDEENFGNNISKDSQKYNSVQERHKQFTALLGKYSR
ncbi:MAG: DUF262 domain-containing protein [Treponema sp.]|jgi:hypothetical protein|nr:DUF262 domain-containing protein [Treponema sp.]